MHVSVGLGAPGESCLTATEITPVPFAATFDNAGAADGTPSPSCIEPSPDVAARDVWYRWTPATSCPNADLLPCGGNGVINMDDILAALAAFGGYDPCGCDLSAPTLRCGVVVP